MGNLTNKSKKETNGVSKPITSDDRARGMIVGAWMADSIGSFLEFRHPQSINPEEVALAMTMPGGGPFKVGPG